MFITLFMVSIFVYIIVYVCHLKLCCQLFLKPFAVKFLLFCTWIAHLTFKCNDNEFPILIIGITDACQQFHPLSISIISHCTEEMYEDMLQNFNRFIPHPLTDVTFIPAYGMTDYEPAERVVLLVS
jgi:hypothetical protein